MRTKATEFKSTPLLCGWLCGCVGCLGKNFDRFEVRVLDYIAGGVAGGSIVLVSCVRASGPAGWRPRAVCLCALPVDK